MKWSELLVWPRSNAVTWCVTIGATGVLKHNKCAVFTYLWWKMYSDHTYFSKAFFPYIHNNGFPKCILCFIIHSSYNTKQHTHLTHSITKEQSKQAILIVQNGPRKSKPTFPFARVLVMFSLALVYCVVFEQSVNSRAVAIPPPPQSFQHLATVLISVFMLWYGSRLLFRGPPCISSSTHCMDHRKLFFLL